MQSVLVISLATVGVSDVRVYALVRVLSLIHI